MTPVMPVTPDELADLLVQAVNAYFGTPIADNDNNGNAFTVTVPATGQLFTVTVADALAGKQARS